MSQIPNAEPQAGAAAAAQPNTVGTSPELAAVQAERDALKAQVAELEPLKGWQKTYVQAHQSGLADLVKDMTAQGKSPKAIKEELTQMQEAVKTLKEVGGVEKVKEYRSAYDLLYGPGTDGAGTTPPASPSVVQPTFDVDAERARFRQELPNLVQEAISQRDTQNVKATKAAQLAASAGFVDAAGNADAGQASRFGMLLEAEVNRMTTDPMSGQRRPVTSDDVDRAAASIEQGLILPMKARGAALGTSTPRTQIPPTVNGRGPSGSEPAKPLSSMTPNEVNAEITRRSIADREARGIAAPTQAKDTLPSNWSMQ
jgi:hypothetical protein